MWPLEAVYRTGKGELQVEMKVRNPEPLSLDPKHLCWVIGPCWAECKNLHAGPATEIQLRSTGEPIYWGH